MSVSELQAKLARLARDEEIPHDARLMLSKACEAGFGPDLLEYLLREAYDCCAGLSTTATLIRVIDDALNMRPDHASLAV